MKEKGGFINLGAVLRQNLFKRSKENQGNAHPQALRPVQD